MPLRHAHASLVTLVSGRRAKVPLARLVPILFLTWLLVGLVWLTEAPPAQGVALTLSPASDRVAVGETTTLSVRVENVDGLLPIEHR